MFAKQHICVACGYIDYPASKVGGSFLAELAVYIILIIIAPFTSWLILIVGVLYSLMRTFSRKKVCNMCNGEQIIPVDSPNGEILVKKRMSEKDVKN